MTVALTTSLQSVASDDTQTSKKAGKETRASLSGVGDDILRSIVVIIGFANGRDVMRLDMHLSYWSTECDDGFESAMRLDVPSVGGASKVVTSL